MRTHLCILSIFISLAIFSQGLTPEYTRHSKKADSLFKAANYPEAAHSYSAAFKSNGWKGTVSDRYNAARAWAKAGIADSAFFNLYRLAEKSFYRDFEKVAKEADFKTLQNDARWNKLIEKIKDNCFFNFGFERMTSSMNLPDGWFQWGTRDYVLRVDSAVRRSGKYAVLIEPLEGIEKKSFGCVAFQIVNEINGAEKYAGQTIEVKAYIKVEDNDEPLGLLLRLDGNTPNKTIAFDNMMQKGIRGTADWQQYSVKLTFPRGITNIYIGVINSGSGKVWCDDFEVFVDGKPLTQ